MCRASSTGDYGAGWLVAGWLAGWLAGWPPQLGRLGGFCTSTEAGPCWLGCSRAPACRAPPDVHPTPSESPLCPTPAHLCRLLGLEPVAQQTIFDFYQVTLEALMDKARREGALGEAAAGAAEAPGGALFGFLWGRRCGCAWPRLLAACSAGWQPKASRSSIVQDCPTWRAHPAFVPVPINLPAAALCPSPPPTDEGIVDIKAHGVSLVGEPRVLHRDATTGATTGGGCAAALGRPVSLHRRGGGLHRAGWGGPVCGGTRRVQSGPDGALAAVALLTWHC